MNLKPVVERILWGFTDPNLVVELRFGKDALFFEFSHFDLMAKFIAELKQMRATACKRELSCGFFKLLFWGKSLAQHPSC